MGILSWFKKVTPSQSESSGNLSIFSNLSSSAIYPDTSYTSFSNNVFLASDIVFACLNAIVTSATSAQFQIYNKQTGEAIQDHPFLSLMETPNPWMSGSELLSTLIYHRYISGNAFLWKGKNAYGKVIELFPLRPDRVQIIPGGRYIQGYQYRIDSQVTIIPPEDILHFKTFHPMNDYFGASPLLPALRSVASDVEASNMQKALLQNSAIPGIVITTQNEVNEATSSKYAKVWRDKFSGSRRGEPAFFGKGMDIKEIGQSAKDMEFPEMRSTLESRICAVLDVPPIIIGLKVGLEHGTYANYKEARESFWEETIIPLNTEIANKLQSDKDLMTSDNEVIGYDYSEVTAIQEKEAQKRAEIRQDFQFGIITLEQANKLLGYEFQERESENQVENESEMIAEKEQPAEQKSLIGDRRLNQLLIRNHTFEEHLKSFYKDIENDVLDSILVEQKSIGQLSLFLRELKAYQRKWQDRALTEFQSEFEVMFRSGISSASEELAITGFEISPETSISAMKAATFDFAKNISSTAADELKTLFTEASEAGLSMIELKASLRANFPLWTKQKAEIVARTETIRFANEGTMASYKAAGIERMRWLASVGACQYCAPLNGKVVAIGTPFFSKGDTYQPAGVERAMQIDYLDVRTPPLHPHCTCTIVADI